MPACSTALILGMLTRGSWVVLCGRYNAPSPAWDEHFALAPARAGMWLEAAVFDKTTLWETATVSGACMSA